MIATGDPVLTAVVTNANNVVGVVHIRGRPNAYQKMALERLYPTCAVNGCGTKAHFLQTDHREDWARTHVTVRRCTCHRVSSCRCADVGVPRLEAAARGGLLDPPYLPELGVNCSSKSSLFWLWQAFSALRNWGELGARIPVGLMVIIPCALGSGKSGSPWARMHSVYLSALAAILAGVDAAILGGTSLWQAFSAVWNWGVGDRGFASGWAQRRTRPPAPGPGLGNRQPHASECTVHTSAIALPSVPTSPRSPSRRERPTGLS